MKIISSFKRGREQKNNHHNNNQNQNKKQKLVMKERILLKLITMKLTLTHPLLNSRNIFQLMNKNYKNPINHYTSKNNIVQITQLKIQELPEQQIHNIMIEP